MKSGKLKLENEKLKSDEEYFRWHYRKYSEPFCGICNDCDERACEECSGGGCCICYRSLCRGCTILVKNGSDYKDYCSSCYKQKYNNSKQTECYNCTDSLFDGKIICDYCTNLLKDKKCKCGSEDILTVIRYGAFSLPSCRKCYKDTIICGKCYKGDDIYNEMCEKCEN